MKKQPKKFDFIDMFEYSLFPLSGVAILVFILISPFIDGGEITVDSIIVNYIAYSIICLPIAIFWFSLGWAMISHGKAEYTFHPDGIRAKFPFRKEEFYPWEEFQQVCVCYAHYSSRGPSWALPIICCVKKGEKVTAMGRWKTENPYRYRTVICVKYTPELYEEVVAKCPMEVPDLRNTLTYRYDINSYDYWEKNKK